MGAGVKVATKITICSLVFSLKPRVSFMCLLVFQVTRLVRETKFRSTKSHSAKIAAGPWTQISYHHYGHTGFNHGYLLGPVLPVNFVFPDPRTLWGETLLEKNQRVQICSILEDVTQFPTLAKHSFDEGSLLEMVVMHQHAAS